MWQYTAVRSEVDISVETWNQLEEITFRDISLGFLCFRLSRTHEQLHNRKMRREIIKKCVLSSRTENILILYRAKWFFPESSTRTLFERAHEQRSDEKRNSMMEEKILHTLHFRRPFCRPSMYIHPYFQASIFFVFSHRVNSVNYLINLMIKLLARMEKTFRF